MTIPTPEEVRLRRELRAALDRIAALDVRLAELQAVNERWYRQAHDATGGPVLDPGQPFGTRAA